MTNGDEKKQEYYAQHEIQDILETMDRIQIARMWTMYEASGCEQRTAMTSEDVFNQVVLGALTTRRWKKDISVEVFFRMTGKSIIDNESKKRANQGILSTSALGDEQDNELNRTARFTVSVPQSSQQSAQDSQSASLIEEWTNKIIDLFSDDNDALCYLYGKLEECKKSVIVVRCKFTDKIYRNVEKRIKDKVRKRHPNGIPWWEIE